MIPVKSAAGDLVDPAAEERAVTALDLIPRRTIDAINVIKEFPTEGGGRRRVLDGISFSVGMGERMAFRGRNGPGESTLITLLSAPFRPMSAIRSPIPTLNEM